MLLPRFHEALNGIEHFVGLLAATSSAVRSQEPFALPADFSATSPFQSASVAPSATLSDRDDAFVQPGAMKQAPSDEYADTRESTCSCSSPTSTAIQPMRQCVASRREVELPRQCTTMYRRGKI